MVVEIEGFGAFKNNNINMLLFRLPLDEKQQIKAKCR